MRIVLLRHGKTEGNEAHRYVGRTDEGLTEASRRRILAGREAFWRDVLPLSSLTLWVSPMRRARETAALLCPGIPQRLVPDFREMDFGRFEYRNYAELMADPASAGIYQHFIDSGGSCGFPEGESRAAFSERVCRAYEALLPELFMDEAAAEDGSAVSGEATAEGTKYRSVEKTLLIAAHGGTLMALLERFGLPKRDYFDWQCGCLGGFSGELAANGTMTGLSGFTIGE